jgi:chromosome segregation ATPase
MAIVTFETVATAAEALQAAGQRASVRTVTAAIGGGSPNTVLKLLAEWKAGRPVVRIADTDLDTRITDAIKVQMQRVAEQAAAAAEDRAAAAADDLQAISEANTVAEQQIASLIQERDAAIQLTNGQAKVLEKARADAERMSHEAEQQAIKLRDDISKERARQEHASAALAKAEVRLEAIPSLQEEINHLRTSLAVEQKARVQAEQAAAVANARLIDAEKRAEAAHEQAVDASNKLEKSEKDLEKARESARIVGEQAAELRGRLSIATEKPQKHKSTQKTDVKEQQVDVLDLLTSSMP